MTKENNGMKADDTQVLVLAPQPFFIHRGTPIAVYHLVETLATLGYKVDLLSYPLGEKPSLQGVNLIKSPFPIKLKAVVAGFSFKKMCLDVFFFFKVWYLMFKKRYKVVHGVEEAAIMALILGIFFDFKLVFDMDSSIHEQMAERFPALKAFFYPLRWLEEKTLRRADMTLAVCPYLAKKAQSVTSHKVVLLTDFSLFPFSTADASHIRHLRELSRGKTLYLYIGNLEAYQGIDLAIEGFALAQEEHLPFCFVCMGGDEKRRLQYQQKALTLGMGDSVYFLEGCPVSDLMHYLMQADVLVSPRMTGKNTPMKIYTYMDSGIVILATRIESHSQVLSDDVAYLVYPTPLCWKEGIRALNENAGLRKERGHKAREEVKKKYQVDHYRAILRESYKQLLT